MLNWRIRYQRVLSHSPDLLDPNQKILEVGAGPLGLADYLQRRITTTNVHPPVARSAWTDSITASPLDLPFGDDAFDLVVSLDSLDHVAPAQRAKLVSELARVARHKVIVSVPCGAPAMEADLQLGLTYQRMGAKPPFRLHPEVVRALPSVGDVLRLMGESGYRVEVQTNESVLQHQASRLLDILYPASQNILKEQQSKCGEPILPAGEWDLFYSYVFHLYKETRTAHSALPNVISRAPLANEKIQLNAVFHRRLPLAPESGITPIFVGEAAKERESANEASTASPEPELDNSRWCELSGVHEVWKKGPRTEYVGFCHYRRIFDLSTENVSVHLREANGGVPERSVEIDYDGYLRRAPDTSPRQALPLFEAHSDTLIVAPPMDLDATVWDHYAHVHNTNDLCRVANLIARLHPRVAPHLAASFSSKTLFANNLFITRWDWFEELCSLWFSVLSAFEQEIPIRTYDPYQRRDISFLSERIFDAWVRFRVAQGTRLVMIPILEVTYPGLDTSAWSRSASSPMPVHVPLAHGVRP